MTRIHLLVLILCAIPLRAQTADEILLSTRRVIESHKSISYTALGRWQHTEFDDTAKISGECTLVRDTTDKFFGGKVLIRVGDSVIKFYALRTVYEIDPETGATTSYNAGEGRIWPIITDLTERIYWSSFLKPWYLVPEAAELSRLEDTLLGDTHAYHIVMKRKGDAQLRGDEQHLYISKIDHVPLLEQRQFEFKDNPQFQERRILTYRFDVPDDLQLDRILPPNAHIQGYVPEDENAIMMRQQTLRKAGTAAPPLAGMLLEDIPRRHTVHFPGHVTLLHFWYADCLPCTDARPMIEKCYAKYKAVGLQVFGVDAHDRLGKARRRFPEFIEEHPVFFPILMVTHFVPERYGVSVWPATFLVDAEGTIRFAQSGYGSDWYDELDRTIAELLHALE